jgi:hypothetical protein
MISKIKKFIIFIIIAGVLVFGFLFFTKKKTNDTNLVSSTVPSSPIAGVGSNNSNSQNSLDTQDFLNILLDVKNIKLDDSIFSEPAFATLQDSTIVLVPDGTEGRSNPFAPIGFEKITTPAIPAGAGTSPNTVPDTNLNTGVPVPKN